MFKTLKTRGGSDVFLSKNIQLKFLRIKERLLAQEKITEYFAEFIKIGGSNISHRINLEICSHENYGGLQTDLIKAKNCDYYGKEILINKFEGPKKATVLLYQHLLDLKQVSKEKRVTAIYQYIGAHKYGFHNAYLSNKAIQSISEIGLIFNEIDNIKEELDIGVDNYTIVTMLNKTDIFTLKTDYTIAVTKNNE